MGTSDATAAVSQEQVLEALKAVKDPDLHQDIVTLGFVKNVRICGGSVAFDIELTTPACPVKDMMKAQAHAAVSKLAGVETVAITMTAQVRRSGPSPMQAGMKNVRTVIAIASGKGGVGKSTVATNLAIALARTGARVGLLDADVYGPSVPTMLGKCERPEAREGAGESSGWLVPIERFGVQFISMGLLTGSDTPVIWRGPMATRLIQSFLGQVDWGELDYLLIDLPPGTGDVQLTLAQSAPLAGAVLVTTPQEVAVGITMRGLRMFEEVKVPILGIVENMSTFVCAHCGKETDIFHHGGGKAAAQRLGVPFLGEVPLDKAIADAGDAGEPVVARENLEAGSASAKALVAIAGRLAQEVSIVTAATASVTHRPTEVHLAEDGVHLKWTDGHQSHYPGRALRLACPCANCVDEWTGAARVDPASIPAHILAVDVRSVGRYALQFSFSDGHNSGIYAFDRLRSLDPTAPKGPPPWSQGQRLPVVQGSTGKSA